MVQSCFGRLGISPNSTEQEIKKQFRLQAIRVHPDKVAPERVEQATIAFRELHEAYEECMDRCRNGETGGWASYGQAGEQDWGTNGFQSSSHRNQRTRATDSDIKKAFNDVCEEINSERKIYTDTTRTKTKRDILRIWPDREACWTTVRQTLCLFEIPEIAAEIRSSNPELAAYLLRRKEQQTRDIERAQNIENQQHAQRFVQLWPTDQHSCKAWVKSSSILSWDWDAIAKLVSPREAADAIQKWRSEYLAELQREMDKDCTESAKEIVQF
ncbi:MAG: hypothetical protein SGARI_000942 [Bacillariaceae sp.]